uniref:DNA-binding protein n=1 Tax=Desulfobacca acetoxidans TaxID=60893 RepID=A0A7V4LD47_9BACT
MKKTNPPDGLSLQEVARAAGVPANILRRQVKNSPAYPPTWREGRNLRLPLAAVAMAAHIAQLYRQGLTTPEVGAKLREGLNDPAKTLRHDPTPLLPALINALERQSQALERIGKELSLLRQEQKKLAKGKSTWNDDLPFWPLWLICHLTRLTVKLLLLEFFPSLSAQPCKSGSPHFQR